MADKVFKHFFVLNLIFSILIAAMVINYGAIAGFGLPLAIIFSGLVTSFFIKENNLFGYTKSAVIISSIFSVFLIAGFCIYLYFIDEKFWLGYSISDLVTGFIIIFSFLSFLNLAGALIGVIPKAITEKVFLRH